MVVLPIIVVGFDRVSYTVKIKWEVFIVLKECGPNNFVLKNPIEILNCLIIESILGSTSSTSGSSGSSTKNIWVSGLSSNTKAADLKNLFGKYGKVHSFCLFIHVSTIFIWNKDLVKIVSLISLRTDIGIIIEFYGNGEFHHIISLWALGNLCIESSYFEPT